MIEVAMSLGIVVVLLAILVPALSVARAHGYLQTCASHQHEIDELWSMYMADHGGQFPFVSPSPGWHYGGVRHSQATGRTFLDYQRPLNVYLGGDAEDARALETFRCPADGGISGELAEVGTTGRTAYRAYGTSFRANAVLLDALMAGVDTQPRGLYHGEIRVAPSRFVMMGDPVWFEVYEETGHQADWHGAAGLGNILFLDGSVRPMVMRPRGQLGPAVVEVVLPWEGTEGRRD
jgi:prepilin-type processing-associated H-X9-DG protein